MNRSLIALRLSLGCAAVVGLAASTVACGASSRTSSQLEAIEEQVDLDATLAEVRASQHAAEASLELARAEKLIRQLERMANADSVDEELLELTRAAVAGQLTVIKTFYARRDAELRLAQMRPAGSSPDIEDTRR